jgi:hypothetical protein
MLTRVRGHLDPELAGALGDGMSAAFAETKTPIFADWSALESYDTASQKLLVQWSLENRSRIGPVYFRVGNRIVAMGIKAAALALRAVDIPIDVTMDAKTFEQALRAPRPS